MLIKQTLIFCILCLLIGCSHIRIGEPNIPMFRVHEVCVKMIFVDKDKLEKIQPDCLGVYFPDYNTFFCLEPTSWGDLERIETIGHELLHAMGYTHSEDFGFGDCEPLLTGDYLDYAR